MSKLLSIFHFNALQCKTWSIPAARQGTVTIKAFDPQCMLSYQGAVACKEAEEDVRNKVEGEGKIDTLASGTQTTEDEHPP